VDVQLSWENPPTTIYIEAKYGSKLSTTTANNNGHLAYPGDQLIRNIRVGLNECGYYRTPGLFDHRQRDFAVIVLAPDRGHQLVQTYQAEQTLRTSIPHSELIYKFPQFPFVGELSYADINHVLQGRIRLMTRTDRAIALGLAEYLNFKYENRLK